MSTKRAAPQGQSRAQKTVNATKRGRSSKAAPGTRSGQMDAVEEKVVRMRKGAVAPDDMELGRVGQNHPATRAKLEEIEARAFEASGRLDEMRREVGLPTAKADRATKQKIIAKLAKKDAKPAARPKAPAKTVAVTAKASATTRAKSKTKR